MLMIYLYSNWNDEKQSFMPLRKRERCFSVGRESFKSYVLISDQLLSPWLLGLLFCLTNGYVAHFRFTVSTQDQQARIAEGSGTKSKWQLFLLRERIR